MKKTLIGLLMAMFSFGSASADAGVNIGISGQVGLFAATATEFDEGGHGTTSDDGDEQRTESEYLGLGYASIFIEKEVGQAFIGVDYVPTTLSTETKDTLRNDKTTAATFTQVTNTIKVDFEDLVTLYAGLKLGNAYIKAGVLSVDVDTKENLGTGSTYGNTSMDGVMIGVGAGTTLDNGMFIRAEANFMEFDPVSLTSSTTVNKITVDELNGVSGKVSIGTSF
jgi:hypothetical protein